MYHEPVLSNEILENIRIKEPQVYVDLTAGGGGHAEKIIAKYKNIKAILIDRDIDAVNHLKDKFKNLNNVHIIKSEFSEIDKVLFLMQIKEADIFIADLGVSSYQFDTPERGFSFAKEGPLDMRMDGSKGITALEYIKQHSENDIKNILSIYAQERESATVARVLKKCAEEGMVSTAQFADAVRKVKKYAKQGIDPSTQVFMALRMAVNNEMDELQKMLKKSFRILSSKGIFCVITFHSTEDRVVKNFFRDRKNNVPYYINDNDSVPYSFVPVSVSKVVIPSEKEMRENPRSRSSKLRMISKSIYIF